MLGKWKFYNFQVFQIYFLLAYFPFEKVNVLQFPNDTQIFFFFAYFPFEKVKVLQFAHAIQICFSLGIFPFWESESWSMKNDAAAGVKRCLNVMER